MNDELTHGDEAANPGGLSRQQRRAAAAAARREKAKERPSAPAVDDLIAVAPSDLAHFGQLHQQSQQARLQFADAAAAAMQQLAPYLLRIGEANKGLRGAMQHLGEKYAITTTAEDPEVVWELNTQQGGFVRRAAVPTLSAPDESCTKP